MDKKAWSAIVPRMEVAWEAMKACRLCPRACGVDRTAGEVGYCRLGSESRCFREMIYDGEEEGLNPSHQVYFAGCNLRCGFCSVAEWNEEPEAARKTNIAELQKAIARRRTAGAATLNLLGGEPAVSIHGVLGVLASVPAETGVVWNSNMYYGPLVNELLDGLVDVWLADFKCGNNDCARRLLDAGDYVEVVQGNIEKAAGRGRLIIRHVVMPGHLDCCTRPVLKWAAGVAGAQVSLRFDYVPPADEGDSPRGYLGQKDAERAMDYALQAGANLVK
jgi:putative pyruvate formate lyase activating enzyme